ncbi:putative 2-keto-3-deoxy-L-galactonate aldolase [Ascobolus immersus RN42]|uniref:Putative 2-keto-3-deoxy-L-galactonate aldolase n=1 Tax=Ascobolus immersus RN42 TaxID=1160509 RepID=A0A3N4I942_ASCIM|nr:putative 2-keto-3-deoxy-L-galactonate aldolase [Ascobolus immersus RN42]
MVAPKLLAGIYCPTITCFDPETEELDIPAIKKHAVRLAKAGLVGLVSCGSNGEAVHLSREEKIAVTKAHREALDDAGFQHVSVMVGVSENSARGTIVLCKDAAEAGADSALLLPPSFYRNAMNEAAIEKFFITVADNSPIPIVIYNYPGAVSGIDLDSDFLIKLSQHPNIVGTKFTCANTGKLTRVARALDAKSATSEGSGYMAFAGMADFLLQGLLSGGSGVIAGGANVTPKVNVAVFEAFKKGDLETALKYQKILSTGDWVMTKAAIPGTKGALRKFFGYGGYPRVPLAKPTDEEDLTLSDKLTELLELENSL